MGLLLRLVFLAGVAAVAAAFLVPRQAGTAKRTRRKGRKARRSRPARRRRVTA